MYNQRIAVVNPLEIPGHSGNVGKILFYIGSREGPTLENMKKASKKDGTVHGGELVIIMPSDVRKGRHQKRCAILDYSRIS
jgi:hypothetical protein